MAAYRLASLAACLLVPAMAGAGPVYSLQAIPRPDPNGELNPLSINDRGEITGYFARSNAPGSNGPSRPFVWAGSGPVRELAVPAGMVDNVLGLAINNRGEVLGQLARDMVVWSPDGSVRTITPPAGAEWMSPRDINDAGTILSETFREGQISPVVRRRADGTFEETTAFRPGFRSDVMNQAGQVVGSAVSGPVVWEPDGTFRPLAAPSSGGAAPFSINNTGWVAGEHNALDDQSGLVVNLAVWRPDGTLALVPFTDVDAASVDPMGINDRGQVVGYLNLSNHANDAMYWSEADGLRDLQTMLDASGAGWDLQWASDINEAGQIIGVATFQGSGFQGVLLTPVPEPSGAVVVGLLLAGIISRRPSVRRRDAGSAGA